ncbi:MAG: histidine-type phosphatase, partial [Alistipes sp.]|nr:histidine-type phosphatase [Alistipes sp.]
RASNIRRYALTGPSKPYLSAIIEGIKPFVRNVIECADRAIAEGDYQATLQYAHDVTIIPFVKFMGIECGNLTTDDYANVGYKWRINEVTPMATNIQLIFYRNKQNDILVKIMHNEREQIIDPTIAKPVEGVYYQWGELREYMLAKSIMKR